MTEDRKLRAAWFALPFFLLAGRALQIGGVLLVAMAVPALLLWRRVPDWSAPLAKIGLALVAMYLVFPVFDVAHYLTDHAGRVSLADVGWMTILHGELGAELAFSGLLLIALAQVPRQVAAGSGGLSGDALLQSFVDGLLIASVVLTLYCALMFLTGYSIYPIAAYRQDQRMYETLFRVTGFLEHPVSFAGMSLTVFAFCWGLLQRRGWSVKVAWIAALHAVLIAASGTRAAFVTVVVLGLSGVLLKKGAAMQKLLTAGAVSAAALGIAFAFGISGRFAEALHADSTYFKRLYFWKVHARLFLDRPLTGHGQYWLKESVRSHYFDAMGFGAIEKFNAHNIFLETLSDAGLLGAGVLAVSLLTVLVLLRRSATSRVASDTGSALVVAIVAQLLFGLAQNTFYDVSTLIVLIALLWLLVWINVLDAGPARPDKSREFARP